MWSSYLSDHKEPRVLHHHQSSSCASKCAGKNTLSGFNYLIRYRAGWLGTKPDVVDSSRRCLSSRRENAYALANPHNFQSMFKAGQLLHAIVLDSASLLISICHGLQNDPIVQSHITRL